MLSVVFARHISIFPVLVCYVYAFGRAMSSGLVHYNLSLLKFSVCLEYSFCPLINMPVIGWGLILLLFCGTMKIVYV